MPTYGYARVSTDGQTLDVQLAPAQDHNGRQASPYFGPSVLTKSRSGRLSTLVDLGRDTEGAVQIAYRY